LSSFARLALLLRLVAAGDARRYFPDEIAARDSLKITGGYFVAL
jgi:hypothetical protein